MGNPLVEYIRNETLRLPAMYVPYPNCGFSKSCLAVVFPETVLLEMVFGRGVFETSVFGGRVLEVCFLMWCFECGFFWNL